MEELQLNLFPKENDILKKRDELLSASKAMKLLDISRHSFEKIVNSGEIAPIVFDGKKYYDCADLTAYMETEGYKKIINGIVDPRNTLNDLTGKDWLPETKSFFYQKGLGSNSPEAQIEREHPAPYSFQDIGHLIRAIPHKNMFRKLAVYDIIKA